MFTSVQLSEEEAPRYLILAKHHLETTCRDMVLTTAEARDGEWINIAEPHHPEVVQWFDPVEQVFKFGCPEFSEEEG